MILSSAAGHRTLPKKRDAPRRLRASGHLAGLVDDAGHARRAALAALLLQVAQHIQALHHAAEDHVPARCGAVGSLAAVFGVVFRGLSGASERGPAVEGVFLNLQGLLGASERGSAMEGVFLNLYGLSRASEIFRAWSRNGRDRRCSHFELRKQSARDLPSSQGVATVVRKNCEPFVFGPALAMESRPGVPCLCLKFSSGNFVP